VFRTYFINSRGDEAMERLGLPRSTRAARNVGGLSKGYPQSHPTMVKWHDEYGPRTAPDPKWIEVVRRKGGRQQ